MPYIIDVSRTPGLYPQYTTTKQNAVKITLGQVSAVPDDYDEDLTKIKDALLQQEPGPIKFLGLGNSTYEIGPVVLDRYLKNKTTGSITYSCEPYRPDSAGVYRSSRFGCDILSDGTFFLYGEIYVYGN